MINLKSRLVPGTEPSRDGVLEPSESPEQKSAGSGRVSELIIYSIFISAYTLQEPVHLNVTISLP